MRKNLRRVGGLTLVGRAVRSCRAASLIDQVVVTTDDEEIAAEARLHGADVVMRPAELANSTATSESALIHALHELGPAACAGVAVFVQCTSPFIDPASLDEAVERVAEGRADSVFSAVETYEFLWATEDGIATGINHDQAYRPRRQDREPHWRETGAFYVFEAEGFLAHEFRFFGRIGVQPVATRTTIEIDDLDELALAQTMASDERLETVGIRRPALVVTDFDGVHTDDRAILRQDGTESVRVNRRDGHGVKLLRRAGIPVLILSTETNPVVTARANKLGIDVIQGVDDKWPVLQSWLAERQIDPADVLYVGNDINDRPCLERVGVAVVPADAHPSARAVAHLVTDAAGGDGVVREVADRVLGSHATGDDDPDRADEDL